MYGDVPPATVAVAVPVAPPKQLTFVCDGVIASAAAGCVMVTDEEFTVQPLASFAVMVYVPGASAVKLPDA